MMGGLPVDMNTLWPLALACVSANIVDGGIWWVLKLTSVPSMSKNSAYLLFIYLVVMAMSIGIAVLFQGAKLRINLQL